MLRDFLAGVRVLDLSQFLPGPFATQLLADMGASVLKIEPPAGDPLRRMDMMSGRPQPEGKRTPYYDAINAGKTVLALDLKAAAGKDAFAGLLARADVLLESYRPGVLDRLGFGRDRLKAINPGLVHCALSGYGQSGPNRLRSGHDVNYIASTGAYAASGSADKPAMAWPPAADYASALQAALTITGALAQRARTGQGAFLDVSLAEAMLAWQAWGMTAAALGSATRRGGNLLNGGAACYQIYETKDHRFVTLGALEMHFWRNFCEALGHPRWTARQHEPMPQTALIAEVAAVIGARPLAHWEAALKDVDCCYHAVLDYAEAAADPHARVRGLVQHGKAGGRSWTEVLFPAFVDGHAPPPRPPVREIDVATALKSWDQM
ncbi:MAG TPA: CoA transferase [Rhodospirillales bacterium]|jgi:crotonobetainyl-CoA:carnitine CoA-transferase CaiB-like acyl-CoA transferase